MLQRKTAPVRNRGSALQESSDRFGKSRRDSIPGRSETLVGEIPVKARTIAVFPSEGNERGAAAAAATAASAQEPKTEIDPRITILFPDSVCFPSSKNIFQTFSRFIYREVIFNYALKFFPRSFYTPRPNFLSFFLIYCPGNSEFLVWKIFPSLSARYLNFNILTIPRLTYTPAQKPKRVSFGFRK